MTRISSRVVRMFAAVTFVVIAMGSAHGADKETKIQRDNGLIVTVITDSKGTTIRFSDGTSGPTAGEDRHDEYVNRYTSDGKGKIISEKN